MVKRMTEIYIVVKVGYEGIDSLCRGFLDSAKAVEYIKKKRAIFETPPSPEDYKEEEDEDLELSFYYCELKHEKEYPEQKGNAQKWLDREIRSFCIQKDSGEGFSCVCRELGVNIDEEMMLY